MEPTTFIWRQNMRGYLFVEVICYEKRTVNFREQISIDEQYCLLFWSHEGFWLRRLFFPRVYLVRLHSIILSTMHYGLAFTRRTTSQRTLRWYTDLFIGMVSFSNTFPSWHFLLLGYDFYYTYFESVFIVLNVFLGILADCNSYRATCCH